MKKVIVSMMMCVFIMHSAHASSAVSTASSAVHSAATTVANGATSSVLHMLKLAQNNPHILVGLALFMSRPLLGLVTQAEEYTLARLAGLNLISGQDSSQVVANVGALALHAVTLTNDQVQENGILGVNIAIQEVQDPATSGSAYAISTKIAQKDSLASQSAEQDSQDTLADSVVTQVVTQGLEDALSGNTSNPALVEGLQDTIEGNAVWGLHVSANIGNYGVQGTIGLSDVVLAVLGALAVLGLQATTSTVPAVIVPA